MLTGAMPTGAHAQVPQVPAPDTAPVLYIGPADAPGDTASLPALPVATDPAADAGDADPAADAGGADPVNDTARAFHWSARDHPASLAFTPVGDHARAIDCMAMAIAYEAGREPLAGQQAVAQVILNRLRVPRFPKSVCGVVFDGASRATGCQFTFTCDGSIRRQLADATLLAARNIAESVLSGAVPDRVGGATHYHADYVLPYWASTGTRVAKIGAHIFYRMPGDAALAAQRWALTVPEPDISAWRGGSSSRRRWPALAQVTPVAANLSPVFAPWGLPVAGAAR